MNVLLFNGSPEFPLPGSTAATLTEYFSQQLRAKGCTVHTFHMDEAHLPFLDFDYPRVPLSVERMISIFTNIDIHIWLSPLYHGGMPGAMKNCLDWLELTSRLPEPYLTNKLVALVCWADGLQAIQGINNMEAVAKALRAWVHPLSIPVCRRELGDCVTGILAPGYVALFDRLINDISLSNRFATGKALI